MKLLPTVVLASVTSLGLVLVLTVPALGQTKDEHGHDYQHEEGKADNERVIFDGVCLEELLPADSFGRGFVVYIKMVTAWIPGQPEESNWHDGAAIDSTDQADDPLHEDILRYHREVLPHQQCDLILQIPEGID